MKAKTAVPNIDLKIKDVAFECLIKTIVTANRAGADQTAWFESALSGPEVMKKFHAQLS